MFLLCVIALTASIPNLVAAAALPAAIVAAAILGVVAKCVKVLITALPTAPPAAPAPILGTILSLVKSNPLFIEFITISLLILKFLWLFVS